MITRHCRRVSLATGRQILLCEETDGGMGHSIHGLYTVDFTKPKFAWDRVVLMADSSSDPMLGEAQTQFIDRVLFDETPKGGRLLRVFTRHRRRSRKVVKAEIDFRLDGEKFRVTPESAAAAKLFGVP